MRILIFNWRDIRHPLAGGAEVFTHRVGEAWARLGHDVTLFASAVEGSPSTELVDGVRIVRRGTRLGVYREAPKFYAQHAGEFDLVLDEINTRPFNCVGFVRDAPVAALMYQLADDVWSHEFPEPVAVVGRRIERSWLRAYRYTPILTISPSSRSSLRRAGLQRVALVPVGVDPVDPAWIRQKSRTPTVLFVGRLAGNKRPDHAIAAVEIAREAIPDLRLVVVGHGALGDALRATAGPNVEFRGRVSDAEKFAAMSEAHALIVTSVREGWGLVVSEAAAVGTTAIAYDVPGLRDSVAAAGGTLVRPNPAALARAIRQLLPAVLAGQGPVPSSSGTAGWDAVADAILRQCQLALDLPRA